MDDIAIAEIIFAYIHYVLLQSLNQTPTMAAGDPWPAGARDAV